MASLWTSSLAPWTRLRRGKAGTMQRHPELFWLTNHIMMNYLVASTKTNKFRDKPLLIQILLFLPKTSRISRLVEPDRGLFFVQACKRSASMRWKLYLTRLVASWWIPQRHSEPLGTSGAAVPSRRCGCLGHEWFLQYACLQGRRLRESGRSMYLLPVVGVFDYNDKSQVGTSNRIPS